MRIATWNVERLKNIDNIDAMMVMSGNMIKEKQ